LRNWDGGRPLRPTLNIQLPGHQHHGDECYRQHCTDQLAHFVHSTTPKPQISGFRERRTLVRRNKFQGASSGGLFFNERGRRRPEQSSRASPCAGDVRPTHHSPQLPDLPAGFPESWRGNASSLTIKNGRGLRSRAQPAGTGVKPAGQTRPSGLHRQSNVWRGPWVKLTEKCRKRTPTLKPHCCWGPNGVSVWVWQDGAPRIGRELAGGQPLSLSSKGCR
jgi:hypothetical protein